jgi:hypothetical protein
MCRRWKYADEFRLNPNISSGLHSWCRECCAARQRQWRAANPEKVAAQLKRERAKPVELVCSECGERFSGRPNRVVCSRRCRDRRYARLHPDKVREKERRKAARRRERGALVG